MTTVAAFVPRQRSGDEPDWRLARCNNVVGDLFFPDEGELPSPRAEALCRGCPIRQGCLEYAIAHHEEGYWGGMTEAQRNAITGNHHRARCPDCGSYDVMEQPHHEVCLACGLSWLA